MSSEPENISIFFTIFLFLQVNNAGAIVFGTCEETSIEDFDQMIKINIRFLLIFVLTLKDVPWYIYMSTLLIAFSLFTCQKRWLVATENSFAESKKSLQWKKLSNCNLL